MLQNFKFVTEEYEKQNLEIFVQRCRIFHLENVQLLYDSYLTQRWQKKMQKFTTFKARTCNIILYIKLKIHKMFATSFFPRYIINYLQLHCKLVKVF